MVIEKHRHEFAPKFRLCRILGANKALPNCKVQPATRIRFLNLLLGKQRGVVAPRHAFRKLRTDPQEWRRFQLAQKIVGNNYADADARGFDFAPPALVLQ